MENFRQYFRRDRRIFLENISYETVKTEELRPKIRLGCKDTVVAQLIMPKGVKIIFNRRLNFEPETMFTLSVSFGAFFLFAPGKEDAEEWKDINLVGEFTKHYPDVIGELQSRTTLLVAEITSAAGGTPLISVLPLQKNTEGGENEAHE